MFAVKFCLSLIFGAAVCVYLYFPGALPEMASAPPANREALVFALFAATLFLLSLVPVGSPGHLHNLLLTGFLQLMAALATFVGAIQLIASVEATFSTNQYLAIWGVVITGLIAAAISYGAFWWNAFRQRRRGPDHCS